MYCVILSQGRKQCVLCNDKSMKKNNVYFVILSQGRKQCVLCNDKSMKKTLCIV